MQLTPYVLLMYFLATVSVGTLLFSWKNRNHRCGITFVILFFCIVYTLVCSGTSMLLTNPTAKIISNELKFLGLEFLAPVYFICMARYLNKEYFCTSKMIKILVIVPVITVIMAWTNPIHHLFRTNLYIIERNAATYVGVESALFFYIQTIYGYFIAMLTIVMLSKEYFRKPKFYRGQIGSLIMAAITVVGINIPVFLGWIDDFGDITMVGFAISSIFCFYAIFIFKPVRLIRTARDLVIDNIDNLILLFDYENCLLDANANAVKKFQFTAADFTNLTIDDFVSQYLKLEPQSNYNDLEIFYKEEHYAISECDLYEDQVKTICRGLVFNNITKMKTYLNILEYTVSHDNLTGLFNREAFFEEIKKVDALGVFPISIVYISVNKLKFLNSVFGNSYGDELLKNIAVQMMNLCTENEFCARVNGDEFALILSGKNEKKALEYVQHLIDGNLDYYVSLSYGIGVKTIRFENINIILKTALENMYQHKLKNANINRTKMEVNVLKKSIVESGYETEEHLNRLVNICGEFGSFLKLTDKEITNLKLLAQIHDIGIISLSKSILLNIGHLTNDEWDIFKSHTTRGYSIATSTTEMSFIADDILAHHERWDGAGYPNLLKGSAIPLLARIFAIVDFFDGYMLNGKNVARALEELRKYSGTMFDPYYVQHYIDFVSFTVHEEDTQIGKSYS